MFKIPSFEEIENSGKEEAANLFNARLSTLKAPDVGSSKETIPRANTDRVMVSATEKVGLEQSKTFPVVNSSSRITPVLHTSAATTKRDRSNIQNDNSGYKYKAVRKIQTKNIVCDIQQKQNRNLLKHLQVPFEFEDIAKNGGPDFVIGPDSCAIFLQIRFHLTHPEYLRKRLSELKRSHYAFKCVLCVVDVEDHAHALRQISVQCIYQEATLIITWSCAEAARYLAAFKRFEVKSIDVLKNKVENNYEAQAQEFLTSVRNINRTDADKLLRRFGSVKGVMEAKEDELLSCHGLGEKKVKSLLDTFHRPLRVVRLGEMIGDADNVEPVPETKTNINITSNSTITAIKEGRPSKKKKLK